LTRLDLTHAAGFVRYSPVPSQLDYRRSAACAFACPVFACSAYVGADRAAAKRALRAGTPALDGPVAISSRRSSSARSWSAKTWASAHEDPKLRSLRAVLGTLLIPWSSRSRSGPLRDIDTEDLAARGNACGVGSSRNDSDTKRPAPSLLRCGRQSRSWQRSGIIL